MQQKFLFLFCVIGLLVLNNASAQSTQAKALFTTNNKADWYSFIQGAGRDNNSFNVFNFEKNVLHVSGEKFGYISIKKLYSSFQLTLDFKWAEKKYAPRLNEKRDAGVLYYAVMYSGDKIRPRSLEFQIQKGDCGDFWLTDSVSMTLADTVTKLAPWFCVQKMWKNPTENGTRLK